MLSSIFQCFRAIHNMVCCVMQVSIVAHVVNMVNLCECINMNNIPGTEHFDCHPLEIEIIN